MKLSISSACFPRLLLGVMVSATMMAVQGQSKFLQILHSSDNESSFQDPNSLEKKVVHYSSLVSGLQQLAKGEGIPSLHLTAGDHSIPGPFYLASAQVPEYGANGVGDIKIYNAFPNVANGIGNHEFDGGIDDFVTMVSHANYPFLAVNLDFSQVVLRNNTPPLMIGTDAGTCQENAGTIAKSCHTTIGNMTIGIIGRAPADMFNVVEDPATTLPGLDFVGGRNMTSNQALESAVPMVLEQVDLLTQAGATVIVLLDHAQDFTADPLSTNLLRGIDVVVSAGSTGFMANNDQTNGPFNFLREGDAGDAPYPTVLADSENGTVLVINSDQLYNYVGHLIVELNDAGQVIGYGTARSGPIATTEEAVGLLATELGVEMLEPIPEVTAVLDMLQATPTIQDSFEQVGTTNFPLNGFRSDVRGKETNLGRLAADSSWWAANAYATSNDILPVDVVLKNGGGIRDTIEGPSIIRLTIRAALAFDNTLSIVELTAPQLIAAMENGVSRVPATDGRFPHVANMRMVYDESKPGMEGMEVLETPSRVETLVITRFDGTEDVLIENFIAKGDMNRTFVMGTNSFLLTGGDGYVSFSAGVELGETDLGEQQIMEDYIGEELEGTVDLDDPPSSLRVIKSGDGVVDEDMDGDQGSDMEDMTPAGSPADGEQGDSPVESPTADITVEEGTTEEEEESLASNRDGSMAVLLMILVGGSFFQVML